MTEHVGDLRKCPLCGDFHFSACEEQTDCEDCLVAMMRIRTIVEHRGGNVVVVDGRIVIRTAEQMRSLPERLAYMADRHRALWGA